MFRDSRWWYTEGMNIDRIKRHPAEVTSDRLLDAYEKWNDRLSGEELDAISMVRHALERIADEDEPLAAQKV